MFYYYEYYNLLQNYSYYVESTEHSLPVLLHSHKVGVVHLCMNVNFFRENVEYISVMASFVVSVTSCPERL